MLFLLSKNKFRQRVFYFLELWEKPAAAKNAGNKFCFAFTVDFLKYVWYNVVSVGGIFNQFGFAKESFMLHYEIDTTENGYNTIEGDAETTDDIKNILIKSSRPARNLKTVFRKLTKRGNITPDCVGYITADNMPDTQVCLSAQRRLGIFLGITINSNLYLSLFDSEKLNDLVDVWGDGLY